MAVMLVDYSRWLFACGEGPAANDNDNDGDGIVDDLDPSPDGGYACKLFDDGNLVCG